MFNLLLALIVGLVIGWNFHSFFMKLTPPNLFKNNLKTIETSNETPNEEKVPILPALILDKKITIEEIRTNIEIVKKTIKKSLEQEKNISIQESRTNDTFSELLNNNLFSEAMTLYVDASEIKLLLYQATLLEYFTRITKNKPQKAVEQMLEFQELEPYDKKINLEILHEIEDNNYEEKSQILLELIKEKIDKKKEYLHQIPLKKMGEHFTIAVHINNESLTLLLDTGATFTMVNENRISSLNSIKKNITLNTAGGVITAQIQVADIFSVGEIELEKFKIITSSFEQKEADGLLGMNFFKKFKFKIDQEKAILHLSPKG